MHAWILRLLSRGVVHSFGLEIPRNGVNIGLFPEPFLLFRSFIHSIWSERSSLRHWSKKGLLPACRPLSPACS